MNLKVTRAFITALSIIIGITFSICPEANGASGFTMSMYKPASKVSLYAEPSDQLSVSLGSPVFPPLSNQLKFSPRQVHSNFENSSLRFNTELSRRGRHTTSLIPVSVNAERYSAFRRQKNIDSKFYTLVNGSLKETQRKNAKSGLGFSVNLPKRLNNIFGKGGAGLRVTGNRRIMFSGRSQWTDAAKSSTFQQSKFPSLHMEQISKFQITGTIGSKITVKVSQNSQTDIPLANRLQIRYKGDEDDILRAIEVGNTNLALQNSKFVGYSERINGLFGIKAEAQIGNFHLVGIASQEKGSSESARITPSGEESAKVIRDNEYQERRIFDLGHADDFQQGDSIKRIEVYQALRGTETERPGTAIYAEMLVDPNNPSKNSTENEGYYEKRDDGVDLISDEEYDFFTYPQTNQHYIYFTSAPRQYSIGVYMEVQRGDNTYTVGEISDTATLKLIYSPSADSTYSTYDLMWRNCYSVGRGQNINDFDIKIYKGLRGNENRSESVSDQTIDGVGTQSYLEILGLDQYDGTRNIPDGKFDDREAIYRSDWGLLIFPDRRPFDTDRTFKYENGNESQELQVRVPKIYDVSSGTDKTDASKYFLKIFTKSRSSTIRLGRPNIIEGSEKVTVNGRRLQKDVDYSINYSFGRITLLSDDATDPNADINIDFEYAPFIATKKKTLFGARAEYELGRDFKIGSTVIYKSDKAENRKPRVGQETAKSLIYDIDASLKLHPNFLTSALDALPLISTESQSKLSLSAEIAQSHPNPNVDDVAYIDDFEASTERLSLGTFRTNWKKASKPYQLKQSINEEWERSQLLWHNLRVAPQYEDIYPAKNNDIGQGTIRSIRFVFRPNHIDTTWDSTETDGWYVDDTTQINIENPSRVSWAGVARSFKGRIDAERAQLFEFRARATSNSGIMHIEFGRINEDINGDGNAFTEDIGVIGDFEESEDVGLDGLTDQEEPHYNPITNPDPNHDNWYFYGEGKCPRTDCSDLENEDAWNDSLYYEWLNGTEGNKSDYDHLEIPDEEGYSGPFNTDDGYFSYRIALDPDSLCEFRVDTTAYPTGAETPWYTYRIPIRDSLAMDSLILSAENDAALQPSWNKIDHIRVWFEGVPGQTWSDTIEIADWYFIQSNWQDTIVTKSDDSKTKFVVASVSEEDGTFTAPSSVDAYTDPNTDITESQRGLLLQFKEMDNRDTCLAVKNLISIDRYSGYGKLKMYVHGEYKDPLNEGKVWFIFRLGTDSTNFYQQRVRLWDGWDPRNHINLVFNEITALKDSEQRKIPKSEWSEINVYSNDPDSTLRVCGNPNLNSIKYFAAGIINSDSINDVSGEVWLDELRVSDVRRDVGTAGRISVNGNLADIGTYSFSYQSKDPYFRNISTSTRGGSSSNLGSGETQTSMSYSATVNVDKFIPRSWGAKIPVSLSYSKSTTTPLLRSNSDIVLPEELRIEEQSVSESRTLRVSPKFSNRGGNLLYALLLNRLTTSFSYRRNTRSSVNTPYSFGESYNVQSGFDLGVKSPPTIPIFFWTKWIPIAKKTSESHLGLYPSRWTVSGNYDRNLTITNNISGDWQHDLKRNFKASMDVQYKVFENLTSSLRLETRRDLSESDTVSISLKKIKLGQELTYNQTFSLSYDPKLFSFFGTKWSYSARYRDNWNRSSESRHSTLSRSWGVNGTFDHIKLLGGKSSSRGGHRRSQQRGRRSRKADVEKDSDRPFYDPPLAVLRFLTGWIESPNYSYKEDFNYSLPGMASRPELKYRFGLTRDPDVLTVSQTRNSSSTQGKNYELSSGFKLLGGIVTDVRFKRSINEDLIKQGSLFRNISTNWPDLTINISRFTTLPLIKGVVNKLIDVLAPRTSYSRSTKETIDIDGGYVTSRSESINQNPLLQINLKLFRKLSVSASYNLSKSTEENHNRINGDLQSTSISTRKTFGASTKYQFSAPSGFKLPIFGRIKFKSTMSISLDVKKNMSTTENFDVNDNLTSATNKSEFRITPDISYTFSQKIRGGLSMQWSDTDSRNRKSHLREVKLWVNIDF